jgi:hypothetical protein
MREQTSTIASPPVNSDGTFPARLFPGEAEALARIPTAPDPVAAAAEACKRDAERQAGMVTVERAVIEQALETIKAVGKDMPCPWCGGKVTPGNGGKQYTWSHKELCRRQAAIAALERVLRGGE